MSTRDFFERQSDREDRRREREREAAMMSLDPAPSDLFARRLERSRSEGMILCGSHSRRLSCLVTGRRRQRSSTRPPATNYPENRRRASSPLPPSLTIPATVREPGSWRPLAAVRRWRSMQKTGGRSRGAVSLAESSKHNISPICQS